MMKTLRQGDIVPSDADAPKSMLVVDAWMLFFLFLISVSLGWCLAMLFIGVTIWVRAMGMAPPGLIFAVGDVQLANHRKVTLILRHQGCSPDFG